MWLISCRKPQRSSPLLIQSGSKTHRSVCDKAGDAVVANAVDHATRHDQPLAAGGLCGKRGADGLGAAAVLSVFPVCAACNSFGTSENATFGPKPGSSRRERLAAAY